MNKSHQKYIQQVISNYEAVFDEDLLFNIFDVNNNIVFSTKAFVNLLSGYTGYPEYMHKTISDINPRIGSIAPHINKIIQHAINSKKALNYMVIFDFMEHKPELIMAKCIPLFYHDGTALGAKVIRHKYPLLASKQLINAMFDSHSDTLLKLNSPQKNTLLNEKESSIVFFLVNGYTQEEIAQLLNLPRGTIARIINSNIVHKLGVKGTSSKAIIERATAMGFNTIIPSGTFHPTVVALDGIDC